MRPLLTLPLLVCLCACSLTPTLERPAAPVPASFPMNAVTPAATLPASALGGALFLIAADMLSRTLIPGQVIPVGVVTALIGAPVFALILVSRRGRA